MLLAAGVGFRLGADRPKPMVEIAGRPILESNVRLLAAFGFDDLVINLHHRAETIVDHFGDGARFGVRITYSHEPELRGTAGALAAVRAPWNDTFAILYGDNLSNVDLAAMLTVHRERRPAATISVFERDDVRASGLVDIDAADRIVRFIEKPKFDRPTSGWVSAGVVLAEPALLAYVPGEGSSDLGRHTFPAALDAGAELVAYRLHPPERVWWIDTPADYDRTRNEVRPEWLVG